MNVDDAFHGNNVTHDPPKVVWKVKKLCKEKS